MDRRNEPTDEFLKLIQNPFQSAVRLTLDETEEEKKKKKKNLTR